MRSEADWVSLKAKMDKDETLQPLLERMANAGQLEQAIMSPKETDKSMNKAPDHMEMVAKSGDDGDGQDPENADEDKNEGFVIKSVADLKAAYNAICKDERVGDKKAKS